MAYSSGTATGPDDLLDKLRLFLIANGWAVNGWAVDNSHYEVWAGLDGSGKRLHVQKTASTGDVMYFNLRSTVRGIPFAHHYGVNITLPATGKYYAEMTGLALYGSTGYDGGEKWDEQPGYTGEDGDGSGDSYGVATAYLSTTAIPGYHFFEDGDTVIVAIEYESGKFQWLMFGVFEKSGDYTGGQFFTGSLPCYWPHRQLGTIAWADHSAFFSAIEGNRCNGAARFTADSRIVWRTSGYMGDFTSGTNVRKIRFPAWLPNVKTVTSVDFCNTWGTMFYRRSPNDLNALAPMLPGHTVYIRDDGNTSLLGYPAMLRLINMKHYDPGNEITYGGDTYIVLPSRAKTDGFGDPATVEYRKAYIGFAVKKVS